MCRRIECPHCGRPGFAGCGMHVEQVLSGVPRDERCRCHDEPEPKAVARRSSVEPAPAGGSWLSRVLGSR